MGTVTACLWCGKALPNVVLKRGGMYCNNKHFFNNRANRPYNKSNLYKSRLKRAREIRREILRKRFNMLG